MIVESPAKAKTVGRFLGKGYTVRASVGHIRDLLRSQLSVDVDNNFTPKYRVPNEKKEVIKELKKPALKAEEIYLATDPDREGESISWHLLEAAQIDPARAKRVVFHEITEPAIKEAFSHPRPIDMDLVNAQQARRVLDRLVGYSISPILWDRGGGARTSTLYNCTVTGNSGRDGGGTATSTLYNSIVYHNRALVGSNHYSSILNYSCTSPLPSAGVGNIAGYPQLASWSHLSAVSPCIGAGSALYASGVDIDGELWADPPSMGADQLTVGAATGPLSVALETDFTWRWALRPPSK